MNFYFKINFTYTRMNVTYFVDDLFDLFILYIIFQSRVQMIKHVYFFIDISRSSAFSHQPATSNPYQETP